MPQMFPMNWFMFSMTFLLLMSMSFSSKVYMNNSKCGLSTIFLKNMKWSW